MQLGREKAVQVRAALLRGLAEQHPRAVTGACRAEQLHTEGDRLRMLSGSVVLPSPAWQAKELRSAAWSMAEHRTSARARLTARWLRENVVQFGSDQEGERS